jgi:diguanylate cyclase (GGDEF)-like protein
MKLRTHPVDAIFRLAGRMRMLNVRSWPFWKLPRSLAAFVATVILADAAVLAVSAAATPVRAHDLEIFGLLLACNAATIELTRRASEPEGHVKDVHAVWELPAVILLPLPYALLLPAIRVALGQWRIRRTAGYRRVFSGAAIGLSYACASLAFHGAGRLVTGLNPIALASGSRVTAWLALVAACAVVQLAVNQYLVFAAVRATDPETRVREFIFGAQTLRTDLTETSMAVLSTLAIAISPVTVVVALPLATLLQRSAVHSQLIKDARNDSKTGLLNAATWERGATAEIVRAARTSSALAVALLDVDRFKVINDTYGHLTGDEVLKEIAHTLKTMLREYDLAGRFGGEEFALLLPQNRAPDAFRIAERVRSAIAGLPIIAPGATGGERVHVTVSIGVAALDAGSKREYAELMAAADAALYRAKGCGRDQVQMISTTRGLSAVSSIPRGGGGEGHAPSLFRRAVGS